MAAGVSLYYAFCLSSNHETLQKFDGYAWFENHGTTVTRPPLDKVIVALKEQGVTTFGASGYCFGARYAMDLALENITKAIVMSHPSLLQLPEDLEVCMLPNVASKLGHSAMGRSGIEGEVQQSCFHQLLRVRRGRSQPEKRVPVQACL
jgi:dienelactone hydrolase